MNQQVIAISGAAAGIGRAIAVRFAHEGWRVGAFDIDTPGLESLRRELPGIHTATLDVTSAEQWTSVLGDFVEGRLDVLVNNAGVLAGGQFADMSISAHTRMVDINVTGTILGAHAAFGYLSATPGAHLVNLCSASAIYGQPELATYSATKAAVAGLTEALDLEWAKHDIRVIALWPLFVKTAMTDGLDIGSTKSLGIRLTADDVANAAWGAVHGRRSRLGSIHYPVGLPAKVLAAAADVTPAWASRVINKLITRS